MPATRVYGVGKISDIFAGCDIDDSFPTKSNVDGINRTIELLREASTTGFVFVNLVETDMLWGHRNDPVNFHRCLQDFDRRLPGHPRRAARRATSSSSPPTTGATRPRRRPTTRASTLLLAYAAGQNAAARIHEEGEFARRRRDGERLAGREAPSRGNPARCGSSSK